MMTERLIRNALSGLMAGLFLLLGGCSPKYSVVSVTGGRFPVTEDYDGCPDKDAAAVMDLYKGKVDSIMSPVIGYSAETLTAYRPESPLSNLIADVLRMSVVRVTGKPADVGVMNMGGIRASLPEGAVTVGTVYEIAPFENALCVLVMDGENLLCLFRQMAAVYGEGLSGARLVISPEGELKEAVVNGQPVDPKREYTVATIDYLAEGNDRMPAFRSAKLKTCPENMVLRDLLIDYIKECESEGHLVKTGVEGRIKVL